MLTAGVALGLLLLLPPDAEISASAPPATYFSLDGKEGEEELACPYLEPESCSSTSKQMFLELWAKKVTCWLCVDITENLSRMAIDLIKELVTLDIVLTHNGMQITREWLDACIPVYLLAMLLTTRGLPLQPWKLYDLGLNLIWSCQYDEAEFFRRFGVTPQQISYVLGLIGQPYSLTPQLAELQEPERISFARTPLSSRIWDAPLVIDVGMGLGADARYYLRQGFRVVAVEANPLAIDTALSDPGTASYLLSGQLSVLNAAIADPSSEEVQTSFWVIPHRPEQSKTVSWLALEGGEEVSVRTVRCSDLIRVFGEVAYMKVDVEFNTIDCLASLRHEAEAQQRGRDNATPVGWLPPRLLSLEVESAHLVESFYAHLAALGYSSYKVCRQFVYSPGVCEQGYYKTELLGCGSGPFGEAAVDYRHGISWRSLHELPNDTAFLEEFTSGRDWFDLHVKLHSSE